MLLTKILHKIKQIRHHKLPGFDAQLKMSTPMRKKFDEIDLKKYNARESAVVILLYEKENETHIVFTQRHIYRGVHSGQISFPGGKRDDGDRSLRITALRELEEELGISLCEENILLPLSWLYVPPSNFVVYPFVAFTKEIPKFIKQESEVKEIIEVKLSDLLNENNQKQFLYKDKKLEISYEMPCYDINNCVIWGATAMILSEFLKVIE